MGLCGKVKWRREWDSNPRYSCPYSGFRDRRFRPLSHLSAGKNRAFSSPQTILLIRRTPKPQVFFQLRCRLPETTQTTGFVRIECAGGMLVLTIGQGSPRPRLSLPLRLPASASRSSTAQTILGKSMRDGKGRIPSRSASPGPGSAIPGPGGAAVPCHRHLSHLRSQTPTGRRMHCTMPALYPIAA